MDDSQVVTFQRDPNGGGYSFLNSNHPDDRPWGVNDYVGNLGSVFIGNWRADIAYHQSETYAWPHPYSHWDGVIFERSEVRLSQITDGTTSTYLIGERYMNPDLYESSLAVRSPHWGGHDQGNVASGGSRATTKNFRVPNPPRQDRRGLSTSYNFGSAHAGVFNMAFCDGSTQAIDYEIDDVLHNELSTRAEGEVVSLSEE